VYILVIQKKEWKLNDSPLIKGQIINTEGENLSEIAFVSFRITRISPPNFLLETMAKIDGDYYTVGLEKQEIEKAGSLLARIYLLNNCVATVNGAYISTDTTININITSGNIPDSGFCKVNDEVMAFEKLSSTSIKVQRGKLQTIPESITDLESIVFSENNETIDPGQEFSVRADL